MFSSMDLQLLFVSYFIILLIIPECHQAPFTPASALIYDFLVANKQLRVVALFVCWRLDQLVPFARRLMSKKMSVNMMDRFRNLSMNQLFPEQNQLYHQAIILDADCPDSGILLRNAESRLFDGTHHWFIIDTSNDYVLQDLLSSLNLNLDTSIILATPSQNLNENSYILKDIFHSGFGYGGQFQTHFLGKWTPRTKFSWSPYAFRSKIDRRLNLTGVLLKAKVVIEDSQITEEELLDYLSSYKDLELDMLSRFVYKLLECVEDLLHLRIEYRQTDSWGYLMDNGSFDGAIGALMRGEAELSGSATHYNSARYPIIDATIRVWEYRTNFVFLHPELSGLSVTEAFLRPYTASAWIAGAGCAFLLLLLLRFIAGFELASHIPSWSELSVLLIGAFSQQGANWNPKSASGRVLVLCLLMFTMMFYQFYSGVLVSTLLSKPPRTINTIEDLIKSNLEIAIQDALYLRRYFKDTVDIGKARDLYDEKIFKKENSTAFVDTFTGIESIRDGKYAFLADTTKSYTRIKSVFTEKEICSLHEIQLSKEPWQMFVILRKYSPYKKVFTYSLRRVNEAGLLKRQLTIWEPPFPKCVRKISSDDINVNLKQAAMPFLILGAGMILSVLLLILEHLWHTRHFYKHKRQRK